MKKMKALYLCAVLGLAACKAPDKNGFVLRGSVPGAPDSTTVAINLPGGRVQGYVVGEKFELRGEVDIPTCCVLTFDHKAPMMVPKEERDKPENKFVARNAEFFIEPGELTFATEHVDSLAVPEYYVEHDLGLEANFKVTGSAAQDVYYPYQRQAAPLRDMIDKLLTKYRFSNDKETMRQMLRYKAELEKLSWDFVQSHDNLYVNLRVAEALKRDPYAYDQAYLDKMERLFASSRDTCGGLRNFREYVREAAAQVYGGKVRDAEVGTPDGGTVKLMDLLNKDGYTMIDFWASWCGPCRASFPHLKEMYERYDRKVKFVSVSIDTDRDAWLKALKDENLPWTEVLATKQLLKDKKEIYGGTSVPNYLLVDPEGRIVFWGFQTAALDIALEKLEDKL